MVKTPEKPFLSVSKEKQEKLLQLMDKSKLSLIKAAQMTGIPYVTAKQILFMYGSSKAVVRGLSSSTRISPKAKENPRHTLFKPKATTKFSISTPDSPKKVLQQSKHIVKKTSVAKVKATTPQSVPAPGRHRQEMKNKS